MRDSGPARPSGRLPPRFRVCVVRGVGQLLGTAIGSNSRTLKA